MAMEDAASIASLLPLGTSSADVPARLGLYEKARYERAHFVQEKTRTSGSSERGFKEHPIVGNAGKIPVHDAQVLTDKRIGGEFANWLYSYDAWEESAKLLSAVTQ